MGKPRSRHRRSKDVGEGRAVQHLGIAQVDQALQGAGDTVQAAGGLQHGNDHAGVIGLDLARRDAGSQPQYGAQVVQAG